MLARDLFKAGGLDNPFTWVGLAVIGAVVLIAAVIIYALTHAKFG
jgi:hypothetical protein